MRLPVAQLVLRCAIAFSLLGGLCGCLSIEQMAPPVERLAASGSIADAEASMLHRGRRIYLTACAKCHTIEPIDRYSREKWLKILPEMIEESKLDEARASEVTRYILAAHELMTTSSIAQ
ncbi:MAG: hypothetical protein GC162_14475 [Planctomycetes bacterium]|nr:hypothetical protein [Planctomycetota bacterium]